MIYYSPMANFPMDADFAARMFEVDNITAIKWTSSNYYEMVKLKDMTHGEMNIMNGPDEMLLMGLSAGADGGIGSTYNVMPERIKSIYTAFRSGDVAAAQTHQTQADRVINQILRWKVIPAVKVILTAMGYEVGNGTFPMTRYSEREKQEILAAVQSAGLVI
jgi:N-acetylneuraminate lyase